MSRAGATKGGKDKTTKAAAPQTPVTATEIVPGKFNESDWNIMVERDNAEEFIFDIVDEILGNTLDAIYKLYLERQLLPFTITLAKDAILQIIEWQYLARDEGEESMVDSQWTPDEEPDASVTDCWAQGSVPKTEVPNLTAAIEMYEEEEKAATFTNQVILPEEEVVEKPELEVEDRVSDTEEPSAAESKAEKETVKIKVEETKAKEKKKFKPYRGKLKSPGVGKMTESLEETEMKMLAAEIGDGVHTIPLSSNVLTMPASCTSILKVQNGRPPGNKDVEYDEMGNVIAVMRLDAEKLPNHRVCVKYTVVDPSVEAAQARLDAMRRGRYISPAKTTGKPVKGMRIGSDTTVTAGGKLQMKVRKPTINPLPPSLLESMDVSSGVQITESGRTKKGPGRYIRKTDVLEQHQKDLQPVTIKIRTNTISVADLLDRNTPILRPIDDAKPLPPIAPHPPISTQ